MSAVASSQKTNQSTTATVTSNVSSVLAAADSTAARQVQGLGLVQQARLARLTRTAANVTAQYGASSTQAQTAQAAVTASTLSVARLATVNRQIAFTPPQAAAKGWSIYGHVYHSTLAPASAYTVFFVDEQNAYQGAVGFVYTGSDGSFQLNYTGDANAPAASQLFLQVVNDKAQPVYLSTAAFQAKTGAATYQDVTLAEGEPVLGDPPAEIRAIAMPNVVDKPKK